MRKTKEVLISAPGRDKGKLFQITEMSATKAENWAMRAFLAMNRNGVDMPADIQMAGMIGLAFVGIKSLVSMKFEDAEPLMKEMMDCVTYFPDPKNRDIFRGFGSQYPMVEDDIEEVSTRAFLKSEVFELHTGFTFAAVLEKVTSMLAAKKPDSPNTSDSQEVLGSSSQAG